MASTAAAVVTAALVTPWSAAPAGARAAACPRPHAVDADDDAMSVFDPTGSTVTTTIPARPGAGGVPFGSSPCADRAVTTTVGPVPTVGGEAPPPETRVDNPGSSTNTRTATGLGQSAPETTSDRGPVTAAVRASASADVAGPGPAVAGEPAALSPRAATDGDAATARELPLTGAPVAQLTGIAIGLLATGALLLGMRRWRASRPSSIRVRAGR